MKKVKRILCLLLSLTTMVALVGCQSSNKKTQETSSNNKTVTFYLIRHGETLFNKKDLAQGWCDSPLTKDGISQASALGKGLSDVKFSSAYSSISERAIDTANLVLKDKDITPALSENLKEMNFGELEAEPSDTLFGDSFKRLVEPDGWSDVGGESWPELAERVKKELDNIALESKDGDNVLISSHGMSIMALASEIGADSDVYKKFDETNESGIENCSVTLVEFKDGKYTLKSINDTSYLEKGENTK